MPHAQEFSREFVFAKQDKREIHNNTASITKNTFLKLWLVGLLTFKKLKTTKSYGRLICEVNDYQSGQLQWAKSPKKQSVRVYFNNMALYFECRINKKRTRLLFG